MSKNERVSFDQSSSPSGSLVPKTEDQVVRKNGVTREQKYIVLSLLILLFIYKLIKEDCKLKCLCRT